MPGVDEVEEFRALVAGLRAGDQGAAAEVYRRYGPFIRAAVRRKLHHDLRQRYDSLDFVQDVWASFLAVPADRYTFDSPAALLGFLTRVAETKVALVFRKRFTTQKDDISRERWTTGTKVESEPPSPAATPSQWLIADERWERLLARFPDGHRVILERLREGYSIEDIARMAGVSPRTVDRIVRRLKDLTGL